MNNMLFAPKENGNVVLEFAVVMGLLALAFVVITKFLNVADASSCRAMEDALGGC